MSVAAPLHQQKPYVMNSEYVVQVDSCNEKPHCILCNKIRLQILNKESFVTQERRSLKAFCSHLEANAPFQFFSDTCFETDIFDQAMAGEFSTSAAFSSSLLPSTAIQSQARSTGRQPPNQLSHSSSAEVPISRVPQQPTLPLRSQPLTPSASHMNKDLQQIREDMRKSDHSTREELRRMNGLLCNVLDEMKRLSASFQETKEKGFTIEDSVYKVRPNLVQSCI